MTATTRVRLIGAALLVLGATSMASAQTALGPMKLEGEVELGVRTFGEEPSKKREAKFQEYRDLPEGLWLPALKLRLFRPDESYSTELEGSNWGQADQEFSLSVGRLGLWKFKFDWDQTPHLLSTTGRSLADQVDRGVFRLPATRPALVAHNAAPRIDEIGVRWDTMKFNFTLTPTPDLEMTAEYMRIQKDGDRPMGIGMSGTTYFYEVLQPIDHTVHDFRLRGSIAREMWQAQFGYALSVFENALRRVYADNPCFGAVAPAGCFGTGTGASAIGAGQSSLPPGNMANTVTAAAGVNLPLRTRVNANFSYSLRLQNDTFLPHTITMSGNDDLVVPQKSLNGMVHTLLGNLSLVSRPLPPLTLSAKYRVYDLNDDSDVVHFNKTVVQDRSVSGTRRAGRLSYKRQNADVDARYQIVRPLAVTVGAGWERWDRNEHREVPETDEMIGKLALDATPLDWLLARLTYTPSFRRVNQYHGHAHVQHTVVEDDAGALQGQSSLLRKFDEAERDRQKVTFQLQLTPADTLSITPTFAYKYDDYDFGYGPNGWFQLGLRNETSWSAGMDLSWTPVERVAFTTGYMYERIKQNMRSRSRPVTGSDTYDFVDFDWTSELEDTVHTVHANVKAVLIPKILDFTAGANFSSAVGRVENSNPQRPTSGTAAQRAAATAAPWPAFEDILYRVDAALKYHFLKPWTATLGYVFESFEQNDWRTDQLSPFKPGAASIWLGNDTKNYATHMIGLTVTYRFE